MPDEYTDAYLCMLLEIPYTVLLEQPAWWVEDMVRLISKKNQVESDRSKAEEMKARNKHH